MMRTVSFKRKETKLYPREKVMSPKFRPLSHLGGHPGENKNKKQVEISVPKKKRRNSASGPCYSSPRRELERRRPNESFWDGPGVEIGPSGQKGAVARMCSPW